MIILIHKKGEKVVRVLKNEQEIKLAACSCTAILWELAEKYPEEIIGWCEEEFQDQLILDFWPDIFHHKLIMASYAVETTFFADSLGYVDQLPFININRDVKYPTWLMSCDVGGIYGKVLLQFRKLLGKETSLGYLLNSAAKIGQQNGLFCYSEPGLVNSNAAVKHLALASSRQLFSFVYQHYTTSWTSVLLFCQLKFDKKFPFGAYFKAFLKKKMFRAEVDMSAFLPFYRDEKGDTTIDVIIPTLYRKQYLLQVLEDLRKQNLSPINVIIVEQDPEEGSQTQLEDILNIDWPFEVSHIFTHQTGACNARNLALDKVQSEWIFFADDDIRLEPDLLKKVMQEISRFKISAINLNSRQVGEETVFHKVKQWGSFGAGTSLVKSSYAKQCRFSEVFEYGFGEDADFGMQLRNIGCDIIYHPALQTLHLKAPTGGFRIKPILPWEQEKILPKPSPTLMAYALKHYTSEQIKGYRVSLFLKFFTRQPIKNPIRYLHVMRERWALSEKWGRKLLSQNNNINKSIQEG